MHVFLLQQTSVVAGGIIVEPGALHVRRVDILPFIVDQQTGLRLW